MVLLLLLESEEAEGQDVTKLRRVWLETARYNMGREGDPVMMIDGLMKD